jgi:hypothetical protein
MPQCVFFNIPPMDQESKECRSIAAIGLARAIRALYREGTDRRARCRSKSGIGIMNSGGSLARLRTFVRSGVKSGITKTMGTLGFELKRLNLRDGLHPESIFFSNMLKLRHLYQTDETHTLTFLQYCINNIKYSTAQLLRDLFILLYT